MSKHYMIKVTPSLPDREDPPKVTTSIELMSAPHDLPISSEVTGIAESFNIVNVKSSIDDFKDMLQAGDTGDTLTISFNNPFIFWVHEDFWVGEANPDYNMPTLWREEIWSKSPADGSNILTHEYQAYDSYSDQPWSYLCSDDFESVFDDDLGYEVILFSDESEDEYEEYEYVDVGFDE